MLSNLTEKQWFMLVIISITDFCIAICATLQMTFYPYAADKRNVTATQYGLVFGVFQFIVFTMSPIYTQHLHKIGSKLMFNGGAFTVGICAILFGLTYDLQCQSDFIVLSFFSRIVEAMGFSACVIATFDIVAKEYPDNVTILFPWLETVFGLGLLIGPAIGGVLFEVGGYMTPFAILSSAVILYGFLTLFLLPDHEETEAEVNATQDCTQEQEIHPKATGKLLQVLRIPAVLLAAYSIIVASIGVGFLQSTLEPHLRKFNLPSLTMGQLFAVNMGTYVLTAPFWYWLCNKKAEPRIVTIIGCLFIIFGFTLIGPSPFIPIETVLCLTVFGLVCQGIGIGAKIAAAFTDALRTVISHGFPNNSETFGLVSSLCALSYAVGAFIGPGLGGLLYEIIGFRVATMEVVALNCLIAFMVMLLFCCRKSQQMSEEASETNLQFRFNPLAVFTIKYKYF